MQNIEIIKDFSDQELLEKRQKEKNVKSFEVLYHRYKDSIYSYTRHLLYFDNEDAGLITSDTFIKVFEYAKKNKINQFKAFLYRTAHNLSVNRIQKQQSEKIVEEKELENIVDDSHQSMKQNVDQEFKKEVLHNILKLMSSKYSEVLYLYYFEWYDYNQIAEILWSNKNSVWTLISRAKEQLKNIAKKYWYQNIFIS